MLRVRVTTQRTVNSPLFRNTTDRKAVVKSVQTECVNQLVREVARIVIENPGSLRPEHVDEIRANTTVRTTPSGTGAEVIISGEDALGALFESEPVYPPDYVAVPVQDNVDVNLFTEFGEYGVGGEGGGTTIEGVYYLNVPPGQESEFNNIHAGLYEQLPRSGPNNRLRILIAYLPRYPIADIVSDRIGEDYIGMCMREKFR